MSSQSTGSPAAASRGLRRLVVAAVVVALAGYGVALALVAGGLALAVAAGSLVGQAFGVAVALAAVAVTRAGVATPDRLLGRLADAGEGTPVPAPAPHDAVGPGPGSGNAAGVDRDGLRARVRRLALALDVPEPDVRVVDAAAPNALTVALGGDGTVCVTRGLVAALDDRELDAVLAHEVAHLANRDAAAVTLARLPVRFLRRLAGLLVVAFLAVGLVGGSAGVLPAAVGPILLGTTVALPPALLLAWGGRRVVARLARRGELVADATAAEVTGDPAALASALRRLDATLADRPATDLREANVGAFCLLPVDGRDSTFHPSTARRIDRLRELTHV